MYIILIYLIGVIISYKFMFNYFNRDNLSDKVFKFHVLFLSTIWPLFLILWISILFIAPLLVFIAWYFISLILFPKDTFKQTKIFILVQLKRFQK